MIVSNEEVFTYLEQLKKDGYHGKVILGVYDGDVNSIKLDVSVDLEYLRELYNKALKKNKKVKND